MRREMSGDAVPNGQHNGQHEPTGRDTMAM
jgi:hypothetical protein